MTLSVIIGGVDLAYPSAMKNHRFLLYPAGAPGSGLLIIRASLTMFLVTYPLGRFSPLSSAAISLDVLAMLTALGLCMRTTAIVAAVVAIAALFNEQVPLPTSVAGHALDAVVLAIVGPGAFSLDARLFGRRTIHLP